MSFNRVRFIVAVCWLCVVVGVIGATAAAGVRPTLSGAAMLFLLGCMPMTVLFRVFRGAPPSTVAEILYATEQRIVR